MKRVFAIRVMMIACLLGGFFQSQPPAAVQAAPALRAEVYQHGDFVLIGNTFGHDCASGMAAPVVGTVGACGLNTNDTSPDVYWRADFPALGQAAANSAITSAQASSTAVLNLPVGAQVTHAYLYWSATLASGGAADNVATLAREGTGDAFRETVLATVANNGPNYNYRSVANVTALVQAHGPGAYRVSDVDIVNWVDMYNDNVYAGWWMVVFYKLSSEPFRQLTLYDGFDPVSVSAPQTFTLYGFLVPAAGRSSKLGVVAMEGDSAITGDGLWIDGAPLSNGLNPPGNMFNGTRSLFGMPISVAGDLPQTTGGTNSLAGIDLDILDLTDSLAPGQTSASITAASMGDVYFLASLVTSIVTDVRVLTFAAISPSASLNIPITDFTTTGVGTAYLITQSSTPPAPDDPNWSASIPTSYTVGQDGTYTLYPWFKDENGSISAPYATPVAVMVDATMPDTTITDHPPSFTSSASASFAYTGIDGGGTGVHHYECALDGSAFGACLPAYTGLSQGSHTFRVRAVDGLGHVDSSPAAYTWTVDWTSPSVTMNQADGQADPTADSPVRFEVVFSEPVTGFASQDVTLSGTAGATTAEVSAAAPNDGTRYTVAVSGMTMSGTLSAAIPAGAAQDLAGNASSASTSTDSAVDFVVLLGTTTHITAHTPDPSVVGEAVQVRYTVTADVPGGELPSGSVTVTDGFNSCTGSVSAGSCAITFTSAGAKTLTASYAGDDTYRHSRSAEENHQVNLASTTTLLTVSAGQNPICLTAAVSINAPGAGTPSGSMHFYEGDHLLGTAALNASGQASLCPAAMPAGPRVLKAVYPGDGSFTTSQHTLLAQIPWRVYLGFIRR